MSRSSQCHASKKVLCLKMEALMPKARVRKLAIDGISWLGTSG